MSGGARDMTVLCKAVLHLRRYTRFKDEVVCPFAMTQQGIAEMLGVDRSFVARELDRLMKKGRVECKSAHVRNGDGIVVNMRNVYYLTHLGMSFAAKLDDDPDTVLVPGPAVDIYPEDHGDSPRPRPKAVKV